MSASSLVSQASYLSECYLVENKEKDSNPNTRKSSASESRMGRQLDRRCSSTGFGEKPLYEDQGYGPSPPCIISSLEDAESIFHGFIQRSARMLPFEYQSIKADSLHKLFIDQNRWENSNAALFDQKEPGYMCSMMNAFMYVFSDEFILSADCIEKLHDICIDNVSSRGMKMDKGYRDHPDINEAFGVTFSTPHMPGTCSEGGLTEIREKFTNSRYQLDGQNVFRRYIHAIDETVITSEPKFEACDFLSLQEIDGLYEQFRSAQLEANNQGHVGSRPFPSSKKFILIGELTQIIKQNWNAKRPYPCIDCSVLKQKLLVEIDKAKKPYEQDPLQKLLQKVEELLKTEQNKSLTDLSDEYRDVKEYAYGLYHDNVISRNAEVDGYVQSICVPMRNYLKRRFFFEFPKISQKPMIRNEAQKVVSFFIELFHEEMKKAISDRDKMGVICLFIQNLEQLHVFFDGNIRTHVFLLLQRLLADYDFLPSCLSDPNCFDCLSVDELIEAVAEGQKHFSALACATVEENSCL